MGLRGEEDIGPSKGGGEMRRVPMLTAQKRNVAPTWAQDGRRFAALSAPSPRRCRWHGASGSVHCMEKRRASVPPPPVLHSGF